MQGLPFLSKFFKRSTAAIGLDAGSAAIKGVRLHRTSAGVRLDRFEKAVLPIGADESHQVQALKTVFEGLDVPGARWVTAVGGPGVVLRSVLMPKMTPQELKSSLTFEAEKHIPFKLEETFLDCAILGDRPSGRMEVLLAAAKSELVRAHLNRLKSAGIFPQVVDFEALGLANTWEVTVPSPKGGLEVVGLLHVGARRTILNFFVGAQWQFSREIPMGGDHFTQALAEGLRRNALEAERIKCEPGDRVEQVEKLLQPRWEDWRTQAQVSFDFYEDQFGRKVERLFLSGGSAQLTGFKEWIQQATGLATEEWDPLAGLSIEGKEADLESDRGSLGVAVGLGLREVMR